MSAGLDEVGMGALAGPVCVAVVVFPTDVHPINGVGDSKKLTPAKRAALAPLIMQKATYFGIGWAHPSVVDQRGVGEAWRRACSDALEGAPKFDLLMIDGNKCLTEFGTEQVSIPHGDAKVWQIGAASIVAKVARDSEMVGMSTYHPGYQWGRNMGYGSSSHLEALCKLGPSGYHRNSFLRKMWQQCGPRINKTLPAWQKWQKDWEQTDFSTEEDLGY